MNTLQYFYYPLSIIATALLFLGLVFYIQGLNKEQFIHLYDQITKLKKEIKELKRGKQ